MVADIDIASIEKVVLDSAPDWWRTYYLWYYRKNIRRYIFGWNKLVSVSWSFAKIDGRKFKTIFDDGYELVRLSRDARKISDWVVENFSMNRYLEVVNKPRVGKSSGVLYGLLRLLLEDGRFTSLGNYVVLVVTPNKRLAKNLYRYLVGLWNSAARELVEGGKHVEIGEADRRGRRLDTIYYLTTRSDLARRVRIRLYLGGIDSCLLGRREHYVDRDCIDCRFFNPGKVPYYLPLMDPWMLKLSGYCPFAVSRGKGFMYNSIVVTTLHAFIHYFSWLVPRHGINKVILILDEVVEIFEKSRAKIREVKEEEWMPREVRRLVQRWNSLVRILMMNLKRYHMERINYVSEKLKSNVSPSLINVVYTEILDSLDSPEVKKQWEELCSIVNTLMDIYRSSSGRIEKHKIKRVIKKMELMLSWNFYILSRKGNQIERIILRFRNPRKYIKVGREWRVVRNGDLEIVGGPGTILNYILNYWRSNNVSFGVIGTSVVSSETRVPNGVGGWKFLLPCRDLSPIRSELNPVRRITSIEFMSKYDPVAWIKSLMSKKGVDVVVLSKRELLSVVKELKSFVLRVEGDLDRGVIDYVEIGKPNGGYIYLVYPHGRVSMGVDPFIERVDRLWVLGGVRRPHPWVVPVGLRDFGLDRELDVDMLRIVKRWGLKVRSDVEFSGDVVLYLSRTEVYDSWDLHYDGHILRQVVGRWFLLDIRSVIFVLGYAPYQWYSGYWDYRMYPVHKVPGFNPKGRNDMNEITRYKRELMEKYGFGVVKSGGMWEPVEYKLEFYSVAFDSSKVIRNLMKRERSLYESMRLIKRSKPMDPDRIRRVIRNVLLYIVNADNPIRFKWLKRIYEEEGLYAAYQALVKYLGIDESVVKLPVKHGKVFSI